MWATKLLISQVKKKDFLPQNDQIWPEIGIFGQFGPGHAGLFSALLVGRLVVVARGLYLARHLFTFYIISYKLGPFGRMSRVKMQPSAVVRDNDTMIWCGQGSQSRSRLKDINA